MVGLRRNGLGMNAEKKKQTLTARQKEIYEFLRDKILNRGYGPTVREIGNHFGIRSPNGVMCHLKALEKKGLISRESHMSRAIQLSDTPQNRMSLEDAGRISLGSPLLPSNNGERVNFSALFDGSGNCCLKVQGNHLSGERISDGDYLVICREQEAKSGDLVVVGGQDGQVADIRRFVDADGNAQLQAVGRDAASINPAECDQFGVVVSIIRRYE